MAKKRPLLTDEQWNLIEPLLPQSKPSPKGGRKPIDNRRVLEGILWVLRTGARWQDLPDQYPSPSTCWRRLRDCEEQDVWVNIWRTFLADLDEAGWLDWEEAFVDASFFAAKNGGACVGKTKRGKGTKCMVVADGQKVPVGLRLASASPAEVTLLEPTLDETHVPPRGRRRSPRRPKRVIANRAYDSDKHRSRLANREIELICHHRKGRKRQPTQDGRKLRRYKRRWIVE